MILITFCVLENNLQLFSKFLDFRINKKKSNLCKMKNLLDLRNFSKYNVYTSIANSQ